MAASFRCGQRSVRRRFARHLPCWFRAWATAALLAPLATTAAEPAARAIRVELPGQEHNAIKASWPSIGCWFWTGEEFQPGGYKRFIDLHAKHSPFTLVTTSLRHRGELTDPAVHDQIKAAAAYARDHGLEIVMDLDVRLAREAFRARHPDEMQEIVLVRETALGGDGEATVAIQPFSSRTDYAPGTAGYGSTGPRVVRVYSYVTGAEGIDPESVRDITDRARVVQADAATGATVAIPCGAADAGRTACVLAAFTLFTPDVYAPHLVAFERGILEQYADVPLAGACKDEWGFPGRGNPRADEIWFSAAMAEAYAQRRPGHDLVRDFLLMVKGERGRAGERAAAINHWMEMNRERNAELEAAFYRGIKDVFGPQALSATHPTWWPAPTTNEVFKNGLDWWAVSRDLAQTDETTPYAVRTALAKKWHSPLWFNMYYARDIATYGPELWGNALGGGRVNYHPLFPGGNWTTNLLSQGDKLLRGECRVRLLNLISTRPVDCPVAVIFGHPRACNWADRGLGDCGAGLCDALWQQGYYADLIPTSEIASGALRISADGSIQYGPQTYAAAVLHQPQYDRPATGEFFRTAAAAGKTALWRVGEWTMDFDGQPVDDRTILPAEMPPLDAAACQAAIVGRLRAAGIAPQTPSAVRAGPIGGCMAPQPSGECRLLDGTVILASGKDDASGDPIQRTITIAGHDVTVDAVGVAAVRLDAKGALEAVACGGLKSFRGGGVTITLAERTDMAAWRDATGKWHGLLQDHAGAVPSDLAALTADWKRLAIPVPYATADASHTEARP